MAFYEIPLSPTPQAFTIMLAGIEYRMRVVYADAPEGGWLLDINAQDGNPIVSGIPLVTGADLLEQYEYLGLGGGLWVATDGAPEAAPTFGNLGNASRLFFEVR